MSSVEPRHVRADLVRLGAVVIVVAAGLLFPVPGKAQDVPRDSIAVLGSGSLPSNIPVKREASTEAPAATGDRWWIVILLMGGLMGLGVIALRRKATRNINMPKVPVAWWGRLGGLLDTVPAHEIRRTSSTRLTPRHSLHVVVWNGRHLLLGCTDQSIQLLAQAPDLGADGSDPMVGDPPSTAEGRR